MGTNAVASQTKRPTPGSIVDATSKEKLIVGKVGFTDESNCSTNYFNAPVCDPTVAKGKYVTTWAFSVKNASPSRSASQVRARLTFKDSQGNVLLQTVVSVANEIKPNKLAWAASYLNETNGNITGVSTIDVSIVSKSWIVPTKSFYQNPIFLNTKTNSFTDQCQLGQPCQNLNQRSDDGKLLDMTLNGIFTWRGPAARANALIIFLDDLGNPLGGWSYSAQDYGAGSISVNYELSMTKGELANVVNYLFTVNS